MLLAHAILCVAGYQESIDTFLCGRKRDFGGLRWMINKLVPTLATALIFMSQASGGYAQTSTNDAAGVRTQIEANNRVVGRAIATKDYSTLMRLWAPEMVVNSPGNTILTRDQVFGAMREEKLAYSSVQSTTDEFLVSGDVAVEMGHEAIVMLNGPMAGKPLTRRFTDVWQRRGGGWVQIARQATYVGIDGGAVYGHPDPALTH